MALLVNVMAVTCFIRANDKTVDFKQKPFYIGLHKTLKFAGKIWDESRNKFSKLYCKKMACS